MSCRYRIQGSHLHFLKRREDISVLERESGIPQPRISASKRETHVLSAPKCETRILPVPERDFRVSNTKRDVRVLRQTQPTSEVRVSTPGEVQVSTKKHEVRI